MGYHPRNWEKKLRGLRHNESILLKVMCDEADATGKVFEGTGTRRLAELCHWSVSHTCVLLNRVERYGLISWKEKHPGSNDGQRLFYVNLAVDPETWVRQEYISTIMSTRKLFQELLRQSFAPHDLHRYEMYFSSLVLLPPLTHNRILCRTHQPLFYSVIRAERPRILSIASQMLGKQCKRFLLIGDKQPRELAAFSQPFSEDIGSFPISLGPIDPRNGRPIS